jgi:hypothetical protein
MIKGYVGTYGSGKTLWLTKDALWFFKNGYKVYSNTPIWGFYKKKPIMSTFIYNDDIPTFLTSLSWGNDPILIIVDEASDVFNSYDYKAIPKEIYNALKQSRKFGVHLFYTSQRHQDVVTRLRENASIIYQCDTLLRFAGNLKIYRALGLNQNYFTDNAKSKQIKSYIKKRKFAFHFSIKKFFSHYMTQFVVGDKQFYAYFKNLIGDPDKYTINDIIDNSKLHKDIEPPL